MLIPFPVLVCDIGGTNVRSALVEAPGAPLRPLPPRQTDAFPGLAQAFADELLIFQINKGGR